MHTATTTRARQQGVPAKIMSEGRHARRAFARRQDVTGVDQKWGRQDRKTGAPAHFREMLRVGAVNKFLARVPTISLAESGSFASKPQMVKAINTIAAAYPNIRDLRNATRVDLLALPGVGEATLSKLGSWLRAKDIEPKWTA